MRARIATLVLLCLGLASIQLPLLWVGYHTWQHDYATKHCVSPDTACNGSCSVGRQFMKSESHDKDAKGLPTAVLLQLRELSSMLLFTTNLPLPVVHETTSSLAGTFISYSSNTVEPPFTPPK